MGTDEEAWGSPNSHNVNVHESDVRLGLTPETFPLPLPHAPCSRQRHSKQAPIPALLCLHPDQHLLGKLHL